MIRPRKPTRKQLVIAAGVVLMGFVVAAAALVVNERFFKPTTITGYFTAATAIYPGDEVRVSGVKVGSIESIEPDGTEAKMTMDIDSGVPIPADAKAVIVAQNLVSARYVELTPAYRTTGPTMSDNAVIPVDRTAVPVEWDEVKAQLTRLSKDLGPDGQVGTTSVARFINSASDAFTGNGDKLRQTLAQLSGVGRILADGSGNVVDIIKGLQTFVTALRDSNVQIVEFQDRLATLTSVVDESRSNLDAAVTNLSVAVEDVRRFVSDTRDKTSEQITRLADVTQNLVDHKNDVEQLLHVAPNGLSNGYADYNPDTGTILGSFVLNNFSNPVQALCSMIGAVANTTGPETGKLCEQYLGPAGRLLSFNYNPVPFNPYLMPARRNVIYSEADLAPGGAGAKPGAPENPPAVSAYTGLDGDVPAPLGYAGAGLPPMPPGVAAPLPAEPSPALYPGAPLPQPPNIGPHLPESLADMLMPAGAPVAAGGQPAPPADPAPIPGDGPVGGPPQPQPTGGTTP